VAAFPPFPYTIFHDLQRRSIGTARAQDRARYALLISPAGVTTMVLPFVIVIVIAMAKAKTPAMGVQWSKTRGVKLENVLMTGNWGPWNGPTSHSDRYESRNMIFLSWSLGYRITPRSALQMQIPLADPHLYALCASTQSRDSRPKGSKSKKMLIK